MTRKLKVKGMLTDEAELQKIINQAIDQREKSKSGEESEEEALRKKKLAKQHNEHNHEDSCPNCSTSTKKLDDGFSICPSCGTTTIKKNSKYLICDSCGGLIPESFLGTDKPCPHCGGKEAHRP